MDNEAIEDSKVKKYVLVSVSCTRHATFEHVALIHSSHLPIVIQDTAIADLRTLEMPFPFVILLVLQAADRFPLYQFILF